MSIDGRDWEGWTAGRGFEKRASAVARVGTLERMIVVGDIAPPGND